MDINVGRFQDSGVRAMNDIEKDFGMNSISATVLIGLAAWTLFLVILMEMLRFRLILTNTIAANGFKPDNSNLSPFMQRIARAHANCVDRCFRWGSRSSQKGIWSQTIGRIFRLPC